MDVICEVCGKEFTTYIEEVTNICPECIENFCNKTPTERYLFQEQDRYRQGFVTKDYFITKIHQVMMDYAKSLILRFYRSRIFSMELLEEYCFSSVHYFFEYFLKDDDFFITDSFSGLLMWKIKQSLNEDQSRSCADQSMNLMIDNKEVIQYEDKHKNELESMEEFEHRCILFNKMIDIIFGYEKECNTKRENFCRLDAISHFLRNGESQVDKLFRVSNRIGRLKYDETIYLMKKEMDNFGK